MQTIGDLLSENNREFKSGKSLQKGTLSHGYKPELNVMDECDYKHVYWFQQLIGVLQWVVELEMIDVQIKAALLSKY